VSKKSLLCLSLLCSSSLFAQEIADPDTELPSPFNSEVEFGYLAHSGNSNSQALNSRLSGEYTSGRYRYNGELRYNLLYKDGTEDKRQSSYDMQADYKLGAKTYAFSNFKGYDSKYSAYFTDYTLSGGLGYQLINSEKLNIEAEVGPGFRYQEPNLDEIDDDDLIFPETVQEAIFRGNIALNWHALESLSIGGEVTIVGGQSNTRTDSEINVTNSITDDIALKLVYTRQYHNRVPNGLEDTDTILSINLLFLL
jgi:putative salt-induced outer membrane protein